MKYILADRTEDFLVDCMAAGVLNLDMTGVLYMLIFCILKTGKEDTSSSESASLVMLLPLLSAPPGVPSDSLRPCHL